MADQKLVDLPSANFLDGTELLYSVQQGIDVKVTTSNILPTGSVGNLQYNNSGALGAVTNSSWNGATLTVPNSLQIGSSSTTTVNNPSLILNGNFTHFAGIGNKSIVGADTNVLWFGQTLSPGSSWATTANPLNVEVANGYLGVGVAGVVDFKITNSGGGIVTMVGTGTISISGLTSPTSSVGGLPIAGTKGRRSFVTDASTNTFATIVAAGGAFNVPVFDDGTNWRIG